MPDPRAGLRSPASHQWRSPASWHAGAPVYGVNTGFGKLASVRIERCRPRRLQRNIVLSHAAGTGAPMPHVPMVRLMLALKLASLARGASGRSAPPRWHCSEAMLAARHRARGALRQGSVGASGDLAPLAHMACAS